MKVRVERRRLVRLVGERQQRFALDQVDLVEDEDLRRGRSRRACRAGRAHVLVTMPVRRRRSAAQRGRHRPRRPRRPRPSPGRAAASARRCRACRRRRSASWPTMAMPRTIERVVCTLWVTIETLVPTSRLTSVDLPALGAPMSATKPQRVSVVSRHRASAFQTPSRTSTAAAASCSASRRVRPSPRPRRRASRRVTSTSKRGAWSGPLRPTIA